jgi:hypothetical protein
MHNQAISRLDVQEMPCAGMIGGMRRAILALIVFGAVTAAAAAASTGPRVALLDRSPALVAGMGFDHAAAVRVTVVAAPGIRLVKVVRSTRTGTFRASWPLSGDLGCGQIVVSAVSMHHRAVLKTVPSGADGCGAIRADP